MHYEIPHENNCQKKKFEVSTMIMKLWFFLFINKKLGLNSLFLLFEIIKFLLR